MIKAGKAIMYDWLKMDLNAVTHMSFNAAVKVLPRKPNIGDMKSAGLTDAEISEREQLITHIGHTTEDLLYGDFKLKLILNEMEKIGFRIWA